MKSFYILRHQTVHYPTVKDNVDLELLSTPQCKVRNSSYEFAVLSKNKILRDFWETQSLKNGLNRLSWKKIASLWLRHLRFESLLRAKRVTRFWTLAFRFLYLCHKKRAENSALFLFIYFPLFLLVFMILIFLEFCDILNMLIIKKSANILFW